MSRKVSHHPEVIEGRVVALDQAVSPWRVVCNCGHAEGFDTEEEAQQARDKHSTAGNRTMVTVWVSDKELERFDRAMYRDAAERGVRASRANIIRGLMAGFAFGGRYEGEQRDAELRGREQEEVVRCPKCGTGPGRQNPIYEDGDKGVAVHTGRFECEVCRTEYGKGLTW